MQANHDQGLNYKIAVQLPKSPSPYNILIHQSSYGSFFRSERLLTLRKLQTPVRSFKQANSGSLFVSISLTTTSASPQPHFFYSPFPPSYQTSISLQTAKPRRFAETKIGITKMSTDTNTSTSAPATTPITISATALPVPKCSATLKKTDFLLAYVERAHGLSDFRNTPADHAYFEQLRNCLSKRQTRS